MTPLQPTKQVGLLSGTYTNQPKPGGSYILLQQIALFAGMSGEQLASLAPMLKQRTYQKGETILYQGEHGDSMFIILSGKVRIYGLSPYGQEISFELCDGGEFFGEMALLLGTPRSANVEALQTTEVLVLHRQAVQHYLLANPPAAVQILETLSRRLRRTTESVGDLSALGVPQRLARQLVKLAGRYGQKQADGVLISLDLAQEAIASMIGTTRESANRALSRLREQDIVRIEEGRILITQPEKLEKLANGGGGMRYIN